MLSIGSSWGQFFAVVLNPNGKTIALSGASKVFGIRNSKGLFNRLTDSYATINELTKTKAYHMFADLSRGMCYDGFFGDFLMVKGDSLFDSEEISMCALEKHLLGLTYFGVAEAIQLPPGWNINEINLLAFRYDSVRTPYLELFRGAFEFSPSLSEKILLIESLNNSNRIKFDTSSWVLPHIFHLESAYPIRKIPLITDGRIVKIVKDSDSALFRLPYSLMGMTRRTKRMH